MFLRHFYANSFCLRQNNTLYLHLKLTKDAIMYTYKYPFDF